MHECDIPDDFVGRWTCFDCNETYIRQDPRKERRLDRIFSETTTTEDEDKT